MSTRMRTRNQTSIPEATSYRDMDTQAWSASYVQFTTVGAENENGEKESGVPFWSERVSADVTISGTITFNIYRSHNVNWTAWMRVRLYKISASSNIPTLICTADAPQTLGVATALNFTGTPTPTTVAAGERLVLRIAWYPTTPGNYGTNVPSIQYGASSSIGFTYVDLTEAVTFQPNSTTIYMRRTNANAIGNFYDALTVIGGSAFTTGVVNTAASGTQIQWTRTGGGTVLEWITPRMKHPGWILNTAATTSMPAAVFFIAESNLLANCGVLMKLFKRSPEGVETQIYNKTTAAELTTTRAAQNMTVGTLDALVPFYEDDRLVIRLYIVPVGGTMAGTYTCTLAYDNNSQGPAADGSAYLTVYSFPFLKAESDPSAPSRADMSMTGLGS